MNIRLIPFLSKVDAFCEQMTKNNLTSFIHEIARTLPEEGRNDFLCTLEVYFSGKKCNDNSKKILADEEIFDENIEQLRHQLEAINQGEICLDSDYNTDYEYWNDDNDEFDFSDPQGLVKVIISAINTIHMCIEYEKYDAGMEIAKMLASIEIMVDGDYQDCFGEPFYLKELFDNDLLSGSFEGVVKECLYLAYMGNSTENRAAELFCMLDNLDCNSALEDVLQAGNGDLPEFEDFINQWILFLSKQNGRRITGLLTEAQSMIQDTQVILNNARKYCLTYPVLYKQILEQYKEEFGVEKLLEIGLEALNNIPVKYTVRGEVALITAKIAEENCKFDVEDKCIYEAFRSDSSVINYMRLRFLNRRPEVYKEQRQNIIETVYSKRLKQDSVYRYFGDSSQKENRISEEEYCTFMFWEAKFDEMYRKGMNENKLLGWSSTFMKEGISLMLLLLYKGDDLPVGLNQMLQRAISVCGFTSSDYYFTDKESTRQNSEVFLSIFRFWKNSEDIMDEHESKIWLSRIEKLISKRTKAIMDNNRRNYYGECAAFIAAYGEVIESHGNSGYKQTIMQKYRSDYSRRRAFHEELRQYGMQK